MSLNNQISKSFHRHAEEYEKAAKVQQEIGHRLIERLQYLKIKPKYVLDLGCGTGLFSRLLKQYYPEAQIVGLDLAYGMLKQAQKKQGWRRKWPLINADMSQMPFPDGLFDLVFANQVIHWSPSFPQLFAEINRVMNPHACFMFSTLGPDTFQELKQAWKQVDNYAHTNHFADMHDLGDLLLKEYFLDPVVDMESLYAHYSTLDQLLRALKAQGVKNINPARATGLMGKQTWQRFGLAMDRFKTGSGKFPLTYEVVYGHAWKSETRRVGKSTETYISISSIRK